MAIFICHELGSKQAVVPAAYKYRPRVFFNQWHQPVYGM